jgi:hypothetical protein
MTTAELQSRQLFNELKPGDRVEVEHEVKVGLTRWPAVTRGTVVRTERRRQGLHYRRNFDDKVFADSLVLRLEDGSLTTATMDEFTILRRVS